MRSVFSEQAKQRVYILDKNPFHFQSCTCTTFIRVSVLDLLPQGLAKKIIYTSLANKIFQKIIYTKRGPRRGSKEEHHARFLNTTLENILFFEHSIREECSCPFFFPSQYHFDVWTNEVNFSFARYFFSHGICMFYTNFAIDVSTQLWILFWPFNVGTKPVYWILSLHSLSPICDIRDWQWLQMKPLMFMSLAGPFKYVWYMLAQLTHRAFKIKLYFVFAFLYISNSSIWRTSNFT